MADPRFSFERLNYMKVFDILIYYYYNLYKGVKIDCTIFYLKYNILSTSAIISSTFNIDTANIFRQTV